MATKQESAEALAAIRKLLKAGDTVYTSLRSVAKSGMSRKIRLHIVRDGEIADVSWYAARILGRKLDDTGLTVKGCGMDMGFATVYSLSRSMFPQGFNVKGIGRNGDTSGHDKDGGYALNHRWI